MTAATERWPDGARAAVAVTFDNLGEAAEQELGLPSPTGGHYSVSTALPIVLSELADACVHATFFVEGVNAETYPEALQAITAAGHECAFHAWRHEDWASLDPVAERENLTRGLEAFRSLDLDPVGFRPPGGRICEGTLKLLAESGMSYCSPAGHGVARDVLVLLPFAWAEVDAYHLLPQFAALREHFEGSAEPGGPERVGEVMADAVDAAIVAGDLATLVLHTWLIEAERDAVRAILGRVSAAADDGDLWVAPCEQIATWVADRRELFAEASALDTTSWMRPA